MKDAYYFPHDANARNDERILQVRTKYGWEGYGLYFAIVEIMRESSNYRVITSLIGGLSLALNYPEDKLLIFIDYCIALKLFEKNENFLWSESLIRRMKIKDDMRKTFIRAGKKGAKSRWGGNSPPKSPPNSPPNGKLKEIKVNKSKEKEIKGEEGITPISLFWEYFLLKTKKQFTINADRKKLIADRLKTHSLDDLKKAVDNFVADDWEGRQNHLDIIYCLGKQKGKPDNLEKWLNKSQSNFNAVEAGIRERNPKLTDDQVREVAKYRKKEV